MKLGEVGLLESFWGRSLVFSGASQWKRLVLGRISHLVRFFFKATHKGRREPCCGRSCLMHGKLWGAPGKVRVGREARSIELSEHFIILCNSVILLLPQNHPQQTILCQRRAYFVLMPAPTHLYASCFSAHTFCFCGLQSKTQNVCQV